ncbi:30S ribosomal protein S4 [Candidatus Woesearchaeota archaeon]|nr:30S ribosomal protein S4 [Candidatus Woesearchaeota archaeon]
MKRKHKLYSKPKKSFDKQRIIEEAKIKEDFGLKNKREIWKAEEKVKKIRERAKKMIPSGEQEKEEYFKKLNKLGFNIKSIGDVLSLTKIDILNRRLQTFVFNKGLAQTQKSARQLIVHKKVIVGDKVINSPSYHVSKDLEDKIKLKPKKLKKIKKQEEKLEDE